MNEGGQSQRIAALVESVTANDEAAVLANYSAALEAGEELTDILHALVPVAARTLQLTYPTPHAMIALEWLWGTLSWLDPAAQRESVASYLRDLGSHTKFNVSLAEPFTAGLPLSENHQEGVFRSLEEMRVFDGFYYAWLLYKSGRQQELRHAVMEIASHEVDSLGHVFIYAATALRLFARCREDSDRAVVLLALVEFLSRKALIETPELLTERRNLDKLLPALVKRVNILGHNVIYAAELARALDEFTPDVQAHLITQLDRNIHDSNITLTREVCAQVRDEAPPTAEGADPMERLGEAFAEGDFGGALRAISEARAQPERMPRLRQTLLMLFARIDTHQPHYIIYPRATFELMARADAETGELALAELVNLGVQAAQSHGLRPPSGG